MITFTFIDNISIGDLVKSANHREEGINPNELQLLIPNPDIEERKKNPGPGVLFVAKENYNIGDTIDL